jgi:DNA adenine methylase
MMISTSQTKITAPALRYHGGKFRLAPWIISHFPPHKVYVEPFGGAAGVLLQKPRSYAEVYNDLDGDVVNFFRVVRDPDQCLELQRMLMLTPYARSEFERAYEGTDDPIERARRLCIRAQMGFGSAGATKGSTGFRIDSLRKYGISAHNWVDYPASIAAVGRRFEGVIIENRTATDVIFQHDSNDTLFYVDPPYVHSTRTIRAKGGYRFEMTDADHAELLDMLNTLQGMVILSGYESPLYERLQHWAKRKTVARISSGRGTATREEILWMNPACCDAIEMNQGIFSIGEESA